MRLHLVLQGVLGAVNEFTRKALEERVLGEIFVEIAMRCTSTHALTQWLELYKTGNNVYQYAILAHVCLLFIQMPCELTDAQALCATFSAWDRRSAVRHKGLIDAVLKCAS